VASLSFVFPHRILIHPISLRRVPLMIVRKPLSFVLLLAFVPLTFICSPLPAQNSAQLAAPIVFGYSDFTAEAKIEEKFLAVPDA